MIQIGTNFKYGMALNSWHGFQRLPEVWERESGNMDQDSGVTEEKIQSQH